MIYALAYDAHTVLKSSLEVKIGNYQFLSDKGFTHMVQNTTKQ